MTTTRSGRLSAERALELWTEYRDTGDPALRDRLVLTFAPMVKFIVYRKLREIPARCEVDDFISAGLEALIHSIDRYDPERGATLEQYAWTRIHGAVLDELRHADWAPRSLRRWDREATRATDQFTALYGRRPDADELSAAMGIGRDELLRRQDDLARATVGSLNAVVGSEEDTLIEKIDTLTAVDRDSDPEDSTTLTLARERLREAFGTLSPRERKVAILLYVYNLKLREIGEILGVTESRVCQLHASILSSLRGKLADDEQLFRAVA